MRKYLILFIFCAGCVATKPTKRINFTAPDAYPEGVAYDPGSGSFFVSSMRLGTIGRVTPEGQYSVFYHDTALRSTYGMKVHPDGKRLFVCAGDANYSRFTSLATYRKVARLMSFDINTGKKLSDVDLSGLLPTRHFPNDIAFDSSNNIYMTDSYANAIYKITPSGQASVFCKDKKFATVGIGLNGIVCHPGGYLLVDNSNTGSIYKVPLNDPSNVSVVKINQYFLGGDGLLLNDSNRLTIAVNGGNDKIYQLVTEDNWQSARLAATTLIADRFSYPATATFRNDEVWVMNAKTTELMDSNAYPSKIFAIQQAKFKPIPKKLLQEK